MGTISNPPKPTPEYNGGAGTWLLNPQPYAFLSVDEVLYQAAGGGVAQEDEITLMQLQADFREANIDGLVAGSVLFDLNGQRYRDASGSLIAGPDTAPVASGSFDAQSAEGVISQWTAGARSVVSRALLTAYGRWPLTDVIWRTIGAPIRSESFQVTDGVNLAVADATGDLTGAANISGTIDTQTGVYQVEFDPPLQPELARYNAVALTYLPQNPAILGLNPVRLPLDGRVAVVQPGDTLVLHSTVSEELPNPAVAGTTYDLSRVRVAYAILYDQEGVKIPSDRYTANHTTGQITMANPLVLTGYVQPLVCEHRIQDKFLCNDAQLSGDVSIFGAITHDYSAADTFLSSARDIGDLQSRATVPFDQQAWTGAWSDVVQGAEATATYNHGLHPIVVTNAGTIDERWRIECTTTGVAFRVIGERSGQVATGAFDTDFAPINPATGEPYFTIQSEGWGGGWVSGNQLRFNTVAASAQLALLRCTLQGPAEAPDDSARLSFVGGN